MAQYKPLFYRGAPASIPQVVAHIQKTLTEEDPDYTPLRQRMPPASIPEIVAHIQEYLTANVFVTMEDLGEDIAAYIEAHPEVVGVYTVNGSSGNVVLDAGNIPIETGEDPTIAGAISYLSSQLALLVADAVLSVNGVVPDDSHNVTLTGANIAQDGSTTKKLSETFGPATSSTAGSKGLVPAPAAGDENKVLNGSGEWVDQSTGAVQSVCNVGPNAQGNIPLMGSNIPLQSMSLQTVAQAIAAVDGKTGSDIPVSSADTTKIASALSTLNDQKVNQGTIAKVENGTTATQTISPSDYVYRNGILYQYGGSTIAQGSPIPTFSDSWIVPGGGLNAIGAITSATITPVTGITSTRQTCYKIGKLVVFSFCGYVTTTISSGTILNMPFATSDICDYVACDMNSKANLLTAINGSEITLNTSTLEAGHYFVISGHYIASN